MPDPQTAPGPVGRTDAAAVPDNALLLKILAGFWLVFTMMFGVRTMMLGDVSQLDMLPRRLVVASLGAGLSWLMCLVLARAAPRTAASKVGWVLGLSILLGIGFSILNSAVFYLMAPLTDESCADGRVCSKSELWAIAQGYSVSFFFVFATWGMLYLWLRSSAEAQAANLRVARANEAARTAEIRALRYQVNPHFLFNCLNSLATLVHRHDGREAEAMIGELSAFLRYGLATDGGADVELGDEVAMQLRYLDLERRRFPHRVEVVVDVAPDVARARVPALILQPLVENAIKHGVANTSAPVRLTIGAIRTADDRLRITLEDDAWTDKLGHGSGEPGFGIGLRNVAERLSARFGKAAAIEAAPVGGGGFKVVLTMPRVIQ